MTLSSSNPPSSDPQAPGWYQDPWDPTGWRWWDGQWTVHVAKADGGAKPRLPQWLSVPVVIGLVIAVLGLIFFVMSSPGRALTAIALGMVPIAVVLPVLTWLDRVEPEPLASRVHAMLWGATVAGPVSGVVNTIVAYSAGMVWASTVSAPIIEEFTKGLGVYWAVRRSEVDGVMDGIVYAGWVGLGFAVIEDFQYFSQSIGSGNVVQVFIARAILTPFAHPLFTGWTGLALGLAVARRQSLFLNALWGFGLAFTCHATWNGSLAYSTETEDGRVLVAALVFFVCLFAASVVTTYRIRRHEQRRFVALAPSLAARYGMTPAQVAVFGDWRRMLALRSSLTREHRQHFDQVHAALARLALFHRRRGDASDDNTEKVLADQLRNALADHDVSKVLPA